MIWKFIKKGIFLNVLLFALIPSISAQNQPVADSLTRVYNTEQLTGIELLDIIREIAVTSTDQEIQIEYANVLLIEAKKQNHPKKIQQAYLILGGAYSKKGQIERALEALFTGVQLAEKHNFIEEMGVFYGQIALIYRLNDDLTNSLIYKKKSLRLFERENNTDYIGFGSLNIGYDYYALKQFDSSLYYYSKAEPIFREMDFTLGIAYVIGNRSLVWWKQSKLDQAEIGLLEAIELLRPLNDNLGITDYLHNLGRIYYEKGEIDRAIAASTESVEIAKKGDLKQQVRDASLLLSELYEEKSNYREAHLYHKQYVTYKDSIQNTEITQRMADQRIEFEVGQKQTEVDLLTAEKRTQLIILIATSAFALVLVILAVIIYKYYQSKNKLNEILIAQKAELERLNETKDKFFSIISHDLRGPVSSFNGVSRLIKYFVESKETDQLLMIADEMDKSVAQLSDLLDNLLNWAMQQQGHFPNVPEKLDLKEMAVELVGTLANMARGKNITMKTNVDESMELWADKNTTMTILRNLVSNALKFTPDGGQVSISARDNNGCAEIHISDSGVGMPADKLKKLFQLQDRKSTYGTKGEKGLGLGLQLVHEFVAMNLGKIRVESEEGKGTTFIVDIPLFEIKKVLASQK